MERTGGTPDLQAAKSELAAEVLDIHLDSYGVGADSVEVLIEENSAVVMLDGLQLQRVEQFLVDDGRPDSVIQLRTEYQRLMETVFRAAVERATGRRVTSFLSSTHLDPHWSVEIFRLAPQ